MRTSTSSHLYQAAFDLFNDGRFSDAIEEFKRVEEESGDPRKACALMISMIYYHELGDYETVLSYAKKATEQKPLSELASINLVHFLMETQSTTDVNEEIRRYLATGRKIDYYQTLFDENEVTAEDFTRAEQASGGNGGQRR
jgi:tetratricopeptide (TPR) repeat protein